MPLSRQEMTSMLDFLPLPKKQEVVSHPENEWNIGSARDVSGPRNAQVEFTLMYWTYFPMPKPIQMAADGYEAIMSWKSPIDMTTTSVSSLRTKTCLHPLSSAWWTCTAILVSASSWSHLCISLEPLLVTTNSSEVMFTSLFSGNWKFETLLVRRAKSSFLFLLSCRNAFQFGGVLVSPVTFLLWPLPLFSLVESLILYALYVSQTMSTRLLDWRWFRMNGMMTHSYEMWKQLWMEEHEQQLLHQRSYTHRMEVDSAVLYWQA